jgi:Xaa-Pro aminopeptidase/Xaa-Pro dipeptidase
MIKDYEEIQLISKAAAIIDTLYQISSKEIRAGLSERQLQAKLVYESMMMGGNPPSYRSTLNPFIVAGGPNGALPHAEVSDREFKNGDMIVIDLTLRYNGYIADATRTFALASVSSEMKDVYEIVRRSQELGLQAARSGASCHSVDNECRKYIQEKGYAKFFIHSTGHGIGLDVHEPPWLRSKNEETLKNNMAITVEPGIYIPEKFGVRIEDSLIIQDNGMPKVLNQYTKDLVSVG